MAHEIRQKILDSLAGLRVELEQLRRMNPPGAGPIIEQCEQAVVLIRDQLSELDRD